MDEVKNQLAKLQVELGTRLTNASAQTGQPQKSAATKDGPKKHHIK